MVILLWHTCSSLDKLRMITVSTAGGYWTCLQNVSIVFTSCQELKSCVSLSKSPEALIAELVTAAAGVWVSMCPVRPLWGAFVVVLVQKSSCSDCAYIYWHQNTAAKMRMQISTTCARIVRNDVIDILQSDHWFLKTAGCSKVVPPDPLLLESFQLLQTLFLSALMDRR